MTDFLVCEACDTDMSVVEDPETGEAYWICDDCGFVVEIEEQ